MSLPESAARTYVSCLTPPGTSAIACLAVSGPKAWDLVGDLFQPRSAASRLPAHPEVGRIWLGHLGDQVVDAVVVVAKRAEPVPLVEVHCHGGFQVVRMLQEAFESRGALSCAWPEFALWTADDPARSIAAAGLANALTTRTAAVLLDQYHGAFAGAVQRLFAHGERKEDTEAGEILEALARFTSLGLHLCKPWRVVIAGAPNVGKSSLVNALAGYERSIVTEIPGTTRDLVTTIIAIDGWPIELFDTAGLRETSEDIEEQGMNLARTAARQADLCLWVLDASTPPVWPDLLLDQIRLVINKIDLPAAWDLRKAAQAIQVSARTGEGLADLCQAISETLVPQPPNPATPVPFTSALCLAVRDANQLWSSGKPRDAERLLRTAWRNLALVPDKPLAAG